MGPLDEEARLGSTEFFSVQFPGMYSSSPRGTIRGARSDIRVFQTALRYVKVLKLHLESWYLHTNSYTFPLRHKRAFRPPTRIDNIRGNFLAEPDIQYPSKIRAQRPRP